MVIPIDSAPRRSVELPADRRQEPRHPVDDSCATAAVMGFPDSRTFCQIVDVSGTGMRIRVSNSFPAGTQIHVQWGEQFFVGDCCYRLQKNGGYLLGLKLVASNCIDLPGKTTYALSRPLAFCRSRVKESLTK